MSQRDQEHPIEIVPVDLEPNRRGYQITYNYAVRYWLPTLGPVAFATWQALLSFCFRSDVCWPSISLLADIAAGGHRPAIAGRWRGTGHDRHRRRGAIEDLEKHGLLAVEISDPGPEQRYKFWVVREPPLLSPDQIDALPKRLQIMHQDLLERCGMDQATYRELSTNPQNGSDEGGAQGIGGSAQGIGGSAPGIGGSAPGTTKNYSIRSSLEEVWREVLKSLQTQMNRSNFDTYFSKTHPVAQSNGLLVIGVPDPFTADWNNTHNAEIALRTVREIYPDMPVNQVQFTSRRQA